MKSFVLKTAMCLLLLTLSMTFLAGCHSSTTGDGQTADLNPTMSADQKATVAAHKQQQEQDAPAQPPASSQ